MKKLFLTASFWLICFLSYGNITDTENPVWTSVLPSNISVECSSVPASNVLTATDNSGTVTITFNEQFNQGSCPGLYTLVRTWTATDPSGNFITHTQNVSVQDTTNPQLIGNGPQDITVNCNSIPNPVTLTYTDNCGTTNVVFDQSATPINSAGVYTIVRVWTAYDMCSNSTSFQQIITVNSVAPPIINSIIQPTCTNPTGSVVLSGLPTMGWTITVENNGIPVIIVTGFSATTTLILPAGSNHIRVNNNNNCVSDEIIVFIQNYENISVTMNGIYQDYNNDTITNVGDIINYQFTITNNLCNPITAITLANNNLSILGGPINSLAGQISDNTTFTAIYVITQEDINNGTVSNNITVNATYNGNPIGNVASNQTALNSNDGIKLNAFIDTNNNGVQNSGEPNFNYGEFHYELNSSGTIPNVTSSSGMYF